MTVGQVFIAASLDGYIARRDGDISWLTPNGAESENHGFNAFYAGIDGIIMGRGTWEKVCGFDSWPFDKPVIVLSATLSDEDLPTAQKDSVRVWNLAPDEAMRRVADEGWKTAYIDGGKLIQSFLAKRLISSLILTRIPVLLGDGLPLFGQLQHEQCLRHLGTETFPSGLVQSHYEIIA